MSEETRDQWITPSSLTEAQARWPSEWLLQIIVKHLQSRVVALQKKGLPVTDGALMPQRQAVTKILTQLKAMTAAERQEVLQAVQEDPHA